MTNSASLLDLNRVDPSAKPISVTPSDSVNLSYHGESLFCRGVYVGTTGDVAVLDDQGTSVVYPGLLGGAFYPISTNRILATGTNAIGIVAVF